jgi:hypothetical protein
MKPKELRKILETNEVSQRRAAFLININERTMRKYIAGDLEIPKVVEFAIKWVMKHEKT